LLRILGVTTWVDAGSFGPEQVKGFGRFIVSPAQVRKFGFVHLYANFGIRTSMWFNTLAAESDKRPPPFSRTAISCSGVKVIRRQEYQP
jgi:predicted amidohydrolase